MSYVIADDTFSNNIRYYVLELHFCLTKKEEKRKIRGDDVTVSGNCYGCLMLGTVYLKSVVISGCILKVES